METSAIGYVYQVRKYANGDIEISFYNVENDSADTYSTKEGKFPKEIAHTLAACLARNIWAKIDFDDNGIATKVGLEEYDFDRDAKGLKAKLGRLVKTGG